MATNNDSEGSSSSSPPSPSPSSSSSSVPLTLHDYMSLGEVEAGLLSTTASCRESSASSQEQIQRLPMFLRLLSTTRNLVSLSIFDSKNNESTGNSSDNNDDDPLVHRTVERLEHVAAIHSVAEGVDVVTCYLAPTMTRRLSRVPPLTKRNGHLLLLETAELVEVARNPRGRGNAAKGHRKRQKVSDKPAAEGADDHSDNDGDDDESSSGWFSDENGNDGDAMMDEEGGTEGGDKGKKRKRKGGVNRRDSLEVAAEDSQEATVLKTLSELVSLVVHSLEPIVAQHLLDDHNGNHHHHHHKDAAAPPSDGDHPEGGSSEKPNFSSHGGSGVAQLGASSGKGQLALTTDDSILAETGRDGTGGAMELSDLGSTVAAIMHHAPALRSRHVANALCRASIPQVANLLTRMGANCPASVASLLLGCIQAYQVATAHQNTSIANFAKQGVLALAQLSPRERSRVVYKLQANGIMWDVQLELSIQDPVVDTTAAATILVHQIVRGGSSNSTTKTLSPRGSLDRQQSAGEEPSDEYQQLDDDDYSRARRSEPALLSLLIKRPQLYHKTLNFFARHFQSLSQRKRLPRGKLILFFKAYNCLLLCPLTTAPSSTKFDRSKFLIQTGLPSLQTLVENLLKSRVLQSGEQQSEDDLLPTTSVVDPLVENLHCAVLLLTARVFQGSSLPEEKATETCRTLNNLLGELPCPSQRIQGFRRGIQAAMSEELPAVLHAQIVGVLTSHQSSSMSLPTSPNNAVLGSTFSDIASGLQHVCELFKPLHPVKLVEQDGTLGDLTTTTLSSLMFRLDENETGDIYQAVKTTLQTILTSDESSILTCCMESGGDLLPRFVSKATQRLLSEEGLLNLPLILSAQLEQQSVVLFNSEASTTKYLDDEGTKFLLRLLHAFEYLNSKPKSPFAFDPRSLPLKQALRASYLWRGGGEFLQTRLYELSRAHCMDTVAQLERTQIIAATESSNVEDLQFASMSRRQAVEAFYKALQTFIVGIEKDAEACGSENVFIQAKSSMSDADLCCTVCSALLTLPHKPRPTFSYWVLCRDPLLLFKCPLKIWKSRGLRRIALAVLTSLLESNAVLAREASPLDISAEEFIASRDVLVVRCLLMCTCGGVELDGVGPSDCTMTSSFIRSMISCNEGTVAALIKQGLPERAVDWLVEYVPECMNDSGEMQKLLSDRSTLTAAERLVAADVVLRIAIVHGQSNDEEATSMAYSALAQLVDSFFLVIGPVGVPVNALIVDDSGLDVTQISRKAAFRMLKALMRVRGRRTGLRKECGMALHKLTGLCKNESVVAGVAGTVAGRRKQLLKEIYDQCNKAAANMGVSIGTQSTAA